MAGPPELLCKDPRRLLWKVSVGSTLRHPTSGIPVTQYDA